MIIMDELISKLSEIRSEYNCFDKDEEPQYRALSEAIKILSKRADGDTISRQEAIDAICTEGTRLERNGTVAMAEIKQWCVDILEELPSAQPEIEKYEYHYDHTDCIWYRPEARNRCPVTCAQYRDGWNDAMQYIFLDGKGYMPYRRDKQYGE